MRRLTKVKGEDYTTGCLLDYDYIKIYYRLTAVNFSRQKELDDYPKALQQIKFVSHFENLNCKKVNGVHSS